MKASFKLSVVVASLIPSTKRDLVIQQCEAELNRRTIVGQTESGLRNVKADMVAKSSATVEFSQNQSVVTAFIEYAQAEVGTVDKAHAKLAKLVGKDMTVSGTLAFPAAYKGHDIAAWVTKVTTPATKTPEEIEAAKAAKAKAKADAKAAIEATKAQLAGK